MRGKTVARTVVGAGVVNHGDHEALITAVGKRGLQWYGKPCVLIIEGDVSGEDLCEGAVSHHVGIRGEIGLIGLTQIDGQVPGFRCLQNILPLNGIDG